MIVSWTALKNFAVARALSIQWVDDDNSYFIAAVDGSFKLECTLNKNNANADLAEFETTYKPTGNVSLSQLDTDGAQIVRNKAAKKGWTFCSLPFEFETSRRSDKLYSKDSSGTDRSFITLKAYDADDVEVTTDGISNINWASIVKTVIDFEPPYDFEIIGGDIRTLTSIAVDVRLWIIAVPDIPANLGGSKEMGGGVNLKYLAPGNVWSVDGRVTKFAAYSASLHTNKIRMILKYPAGTNENIQTVIQLYKA